jgi:hypothetical protein
VCRILHERKIASEEALRAAAKVRLEFELRPDRGVDHFLETQSRKWPFENRHTFFHTFHDVSPSSCFSFLSLIPLLAMPPKHRDGDVVAVVCAHQLG